MSVLIKGMKTPRKCVECFFCVIGTHCSALKCHDVEDAILRGKRYSGCPLVELPDHGGLIDAKSISEKIDNIWDGRPLSMLGCEILAMIDKEPRVIEAERSEDERTFKESAEV